MGTAMLQQNSLSIHIYYNKRSSGIIGHFAAPGKNRPMSDDLLEEPVSGFDRKGFPASTHYPKDPLKVRKQPGFAVCSNSPHQTFPHPPTPSISTFEVRGEFRLQTIPSSVYWRRKAAGCGDARGRGGSDVGTIDTPPTQNGRQEENSRLDRPAKKETSYREKVLERFPPQ
jgi:hypothetical protein